MISVFARDLAVDLGTANTLIYARGKGQVLYEPSAIALKNEGTRKTPVAFGAEAKSMLGKTPVGVSVIRPVRTGVIADFEAATVMLREFLSRARDRAFSMLKPKVIVGVPGGITEVEKRAIRDSLEGITHDVRLIDEAMAAAIGCGLPVTEPQASLIVDIGGGTTDIAVISLNDIVHAVSLPQGGDAMDEAIIHYLRRRHHLLIGEQTAETIKQAVGSAHPDFDTQEVEVRGRSLVTGSPAALTIDGSQIREAIEEVVTSIVGGIRLTLENTPPELAGDILSTGVCLAGGGSLLKGLPKRITEELGVTVLGAERPLAAVCEGAGTCLDNLDRFGEVLF